MDAFDQLGALLTLFSLAGYVLFIRSFAKSPHVPVEVRPRRRRAQR